MAITFERRIEIHAVNLETGTTSMEQVNITNLLNATMLEQVTGFRSALVHTSGSFKYLHVTINSRVGDTWLLMLRKNVTLGLGSTNFTRVGSIFDGNVTAVELYHDHLSDLHELYIAVNKTNITFTIVHQVSILPQGTMNVRNPNLRVQDTCVTHIKAS